MEDIVFVLLSYGDKLILQKLQSNGNIVYRKLNFFILEGAFLCVPNFFVWF